MDVQDLAKNYNAQVIEKEHEIGVRLNGRFRFKWFAGCDRNTLARRYIMEC